MRVRQVQAPQAPRRDLREMRRRSDARQSAPGAHGPHRACEPGRPYLVPEIAAVPPGPGARHDAARHRARAVFRSLCRHRPGPDAAQAMPAAHRGRLSRQGGRVRRRFLGRDGRRRHPLAAALDRAQQGDRQPAQGARGHLERREDQEDRQAPEGAGRLQGLQHQARLDGDGGAAGAAAGAAPARSAGRRSLCDVRPE